MLNLSKIAASVASAVASSFKARERAATILNEAFPAGRFADFTEYAATRDALKAALEARGIEKPARVISELLSRANLRPLNKDGTERAPGGGKAPKAPKVNAGEPAAPGEPVKLTRADLVRLLFNAYDSDIAAAVDYAASHIVSFVAWHAQEVARAAQSEPAAPVAPSEPAAPVTVTRRSRRAAA